MLLSCVTPRPLSLAASLVDRPTHARKLTSRHWRCGACRRTSIARNRSGSENWQMRRPIRVTLEACARWRRSMMRLLLNWRARATAVGMIMKNKRARRSPNYDRRLTRPIQLADGTRLKTLKDAADFFWKSVLHGHAMGPAGDRNRDAHRCGPDRQAGGHRGRDRTGGDRAARAAAALSVKLSATASKGALAASSCSSARH
jgi:hypothetical protein